MHGSIPCCSDNLNVESIAQLRCSEESIPQSVRDVFQPIQNQLLALGFHSPVFYALWDGFHVNRIYRVEYAAQNGEGFARIHFRQWEKAYPPKKATYVVFTSIFSDGTLLVSSSAKWSTAPANVTLNVLPGESPENLWHTHLAKIQQIQKSFHQITGMDGVIWAGEKYHADFFNFYLRRGLFQPLSDAEQQSEAADRGTLQEMQSAGKKYPEILLEIKKLQEQKSPRWTRLLVILGLSALVFIALGFQSWNREYVYLLIPILLLHEAGHFLMMKIFGYRNLKMFFIPLFGAAVSGRNYNVAGWKKVVVSLMGPAPGIMLGAMLGCLGLIFHNAFLQKFSLLLLIINGFNLIPFIPLDGGWALQSIIFSRHYFFDAAFKVAAALAMLGLSILLKAKSLMYVGIVTLVSLPVAISVSKVTTKLRKQGFVAASPDDQNIPDAVAETIITELKATMPKAGTSKNVAQLTLQVFESLNAKPPGLAASLGLLAWYGATVLMAVVFAAIVFAGQSGIFGSLLANAGMIPRLKYDCHSVKSVRHGESNGSHLNIVMTFKKPAKADEAFNTFVSLLGEQESLEKIGQTLVLTMPSAIKKLDWTGWIGSKLILPMPLWIGRTTRRHFPLSASLPTRLRLQTSSMNCMNYSIRLSRVGI
ncbi:MAG TPA: site-2 protease family protein, partial [Verrucomicrobiae bacterium]|nr:site-2 protease family protein [Verrucomicrobiae bacterium]